MDNISMLIIDLLLVIIAELAWELAKKIDENKELKRQLELIKKEK